MCVLCIVPESKLEWSSVETTLKDLQFWSNVYESEQFRFKACDFENPPNKHAVQFLLIKNGLKKILASR